MSSVAQMLSSKVDVAAIAPLAKAAMKPTVLRAERMFMAFRETGR